VPTSATATMGGASWQNASDSSTIDWVGGVSISATDNLAVLQTQGRVKVAGTAGDVVMQWAQNVNTAVNTTVEEGSMMLVWEE